MESFFNTPRTMKGPCMAAILKRNSKTLLVLGEIPNAAAGSHHGIGVQRVLNSLLQEYGKVRETVDIFVNDASVMLERKGSPAYTGLDSVIARSDEWKQSSAVRVHYIDIRGDGCMLPPTQAPWEVVQSGYPAMELLENLKGMTFERTAIANLLVILERLVYQYAALADTLRRKTPKPAFLRLLTKQLQKISDSDRRVLEKVIRTAIKKTATITKDAITILRDIRIAGDESRPIAECRERVLVVWGKAVRIANNYYNVYTNMTSLYGLQRLSKPYVKNAIMYTEYAQAKFMVALLAKRMGYEIVSFNDACTSNRPGSVRVSLQNQGYSSEYDDQHYDLVKKYLAKAERQNKRSVDKLVGDLGMVVGEEDPDMGVVNERLENDGTLRTKYRAALRSQNKKSRSSNQVTREAQELSRYANTKYGGDMGLLLYKMVSMGGDKKSKYNPCLDDEDCSGPKTCKQGLCVGEVEKAADEVAHMVYGKNEKDEKELNKKHGKVDDVCHGTSKEDGKCGNNLVCDKGTFMCRNKTFQEQTWGEAIASVPVGEAVNAGALVIGSGLAAVGSGLVAATKIDSSRLWRDVV